MIYINNNQNFLELDLVMQENNDLPSKGDAVMTIKVSSNNYAGQNDFWVFKKALSKFCCDLIALEKKRIGKAILESMSPKELCLEIFSIDSLGQMGVRGTTGSQFLNGSHRFPHSVTFGFEFDPSQLVKMVAVEWVKENSAKP